MYILRISAQAYSNCKAVWFSLVALPQRRPDTIEVNQKISVSGWPDDIPKVSTGKMSKSQIEQLLHGFRNDTIRFYRLSEAEVEEAKVRAPREAKTFGDDAETEASARKRKGVAENSLRNLKRRSKKGNDTNKENVSPTTTTPSLAPQPPSPRPLPMSIIPLNTCLENPLPSSSAALGKSSEAQANLSDLTVANQIIDPAVAAQEVANDLARISSSTNAPPFDPLFLDASNVSNGLSWDDMQMIDRLVALSDSGGGPIVPGSDDLYQLPPHILFGNYYGAGNM